MKTTVRIFAMLMASFYCDAVLAGIEAYGTATYRQPTVSPFRGGTFVTSLGTTTKLQMDIYSGMMRETSIFITS